MSKQLQFSCSFIVNKRRATDSSIPPGLNNKVHSIYISVPWSVRFTLMDLALRVLFHWFQIIFDRIRLTVAVATGTKSTPPHRPQCYCLSRHVLAVPMHGIIIASIKLSDFLLLSSMIRRLLIKRSDVWSKSEGEIKLTKALSFKRGLRSSQDFCQQSRLQRHSLSFFVDMPHSQWSERGSRKFSHKKFFL